MSKKRSKRAALRLRRRLITLVLLALLIALFFFAFRLQTVYVSGNIHNKPGEITELILEKPVLGNTVLAKLFNTNRTIDSAGFADRINVHILDRNTVRVIVTERRFVGRIMYGGRWYYFDSSGEVLAEAETAAEGDGIPPVEGLSPLSDPVVPGKLQITNTKVFSMLGMLRNRTEVQKEMIPDRVVFGSDSSMSLSYGDVTVLLGSGEKLELRLRQLSGVLPELMKGYRGTLHLETYDGSQSGLIFDPV